MFPLGNAARARGLVSLGTGAISCGWSDIAILLGSKDGDQTPSLQTLLASGLCEITLRCLMMPHEIGIGPRLMSCKSEFASSIFIGRPEIEQPRKGAGANRVGNKICFRRGRRRGIVVNIEDGARDRGRAKNSALAAAADIGGDLWTGHRAAPAC